MRNFFNAKLVFWGMLYFLNFNELTSMRVSKSNLSVNNKKLCLRVIVESNIQDLLNEKDINVNYNCGNGNTPLHLACQSGNVAAVKVLLNHYKYKLTPPFFKYTVDVNASNCNRDTPINLAIYNNRFLTIKALLEDKNHNINLNLKNVKNQTSFYLLIKSKLNKNFSLESKISLIKLFAEKGADPSLKNKDGNTVLHKAAMICNGKIIDALFLNFPNITIDILNTFDETPLYLAADYDNVGALKELLENGANPNLMNKFSLSPLDIAVINQHLDAVKILASSDTITNINVNLLTTKAIKKLKKFNKIFSGGETALHFAYYVNNKEIIEVLIKAGVKENIKNRAGFTAKELYEHILDSNIGTLKDLSTSLIALESISSE